jgi:hypothetical protein
MMPYTSASNSAGSPAFLFAAAPIPQYLHPARRTAPYSATSASHLRLHSPAALPFRLEEGPAEDARLSATMAHFWNAETERAQPSLSTAATVATSARVSAAVH